MFDSGNNIARSTDEALPLQDSLDTLFAAIKAQLKSDIGETAHRSWIAPLEARALNNGALEIAVPTRFVRDWVKTHYVETLLRLWSQRADVRRIELVIAPHIAAAPAVFQPIEIANENAASAQSALSAALDARFTLQNYVTGPSNALAHGAATRVAAGESQGLNPLYITGAVGLGKTHLMQGIAHAARARDPGCNVVYMSAEKFMYSFVRALRARDTMAFKEAFRAIDILMIDDIQFICGKESTQEEFFYTFNALIDQGKQVVLSSSVPPSELEGMDARLVSRLGMGLVAKIEAPDAHLRLAILQSKCALMKRDLPADVLAFLADKITASGRELEGALNRLIAHADMAGRVITVDSASEILQDLLRASDKRLSVEDIQKAVAEHFGIRVADILSPRRARPLARPRQVAMYLAKILTPFSLPDIGRKFAGRDHTTIIHGVRKIEELMQTDAGMREDVAKLKKLLAV